MYFWINIVPTHMVNYISILWEIHFCTVVADMFNICISKAPYSNVFIKKHCFDGFEYTWSHDKGKVSFRWGIFGLLWLRSTICVIWCLSICYFCLTPLGLVILVYCGFILWAISLILSLIRSLAMVCSTTTGDTDQVRRWFHLVKNGLRLWQNDICFSFQFSF